MSRNAKRDAPQGPHPTVPRWGWARAAGESVLGEATGAFQRAGFADPTLVLRWSQIVGPHIARIARPMRWQDGADGAVLTLNCEPGAAVLLQHETRALIERLNAYLGQGRIARLKLVSGQLSERAEPSRHPAPDAPPPAESLDLPEALERLARARAQAKIRGPKRPD